MRQSVRRTLTDARLRLSVEHERAGPTAYAPGMSMATPGGGNAQPDACPHCGGVPVTEVGIAIVPGDATLRWRFQCAKCGHRFIWPPTTS